MKTFVSPSDFALLFEANTSFRPSGENIGKPSKVELQRHLLQAGSVEVDEEDIEVTPFGIARVRGKNDPLSVRMPRRREIGSAEPRHLAQVAAVAVHHEISSVVGRHSSFFNRLVIGQLFLIAMARPRNTICFPSGENHGPPSGPARFVRRRTSEPSPFIE